MAVDFQQQTLTVNGNKVLYWLGGQGPALLYLHGAGGFRPTPALVALSRDYSVYGLVAPGFGHTALLTEVASMPDLADYAGAFVQERIGAPVHLVGHSFGGWWAAWLAVRQPAAVMTLILETPAGFRRLGGSGLHGDAESIQRRMYAHPEKIRPEFQSEGRDERVLGHYHGNVGQDQALTDALSKIAMPTLIVLGTEDGVIHADTGRLLRDRIAGAQLAYVYDAAHIIEVDQPERFVRLARDFLRYGASYLIRWHNE